MDQRIVEFVAALRSAGVRVSLAESADSMRAIEAIGVIDRALFRNALKATLIKEPADVKPFDQLFPNFFGSEGPEMQAPEGLSEEEQQMLNDALEELRERIREVMKMLANGERPSREQLREAAQHAGMREGQRANPQVQKWLTERMLREMNLTPEQLRDAIEALMKQLKEQGMNADGRREVRETVQANAEAMREQVSRFVGQSMLNQRDEDTQRRQKIDELMDRPLNRLSDAESDELRAHVRRLVARLRSRAALRLRRGKRGNFDTRGTLRANMRNLGVPIELRYRKRHLKPRLVVIVDVSTSMRPVVEFMLRLVYEMQDQVSKTRSFAFISDLHDISLTFVEHRPEDAVPRVLEALPPGHYNTDLGNSLNTFARDFLDSVDRRTSLIIVGDGRNNYNDPRVDVLQALKLRVRRIVWMNPESPWMWNTGDSDMAQYAPLCDAVHEVATLKQLADAVDDLFSYR